MGNRARTVARSWRSAPRRRRAPSPMAASRILSRDVNRPGLSPPAPGSPTPRFNGLPSAGPRSRPRRRAGRDRARRDARRFYPVPRGRGPAPLRDVGPGRILRSLPAPDETPEAMATEFSLAEIADRIGGEVRGDGSIRISRVRELASAGPGDLSFLSNERYRPLLGRTRASAAIVGAGEEAPCATIRVADPYLGLCRALELFHPAALPRLPGLHASAVVDPTATVSPRAHVGPLCVIEARARIEDGVVLRASVFVGEGSTIGEGSYLYPGVVVREGVRLGRRVILHSGVVL